MYVRDLFMEFGHLAVVSVVVAAGSGIPALGGGMVRGERRLAA